jgi:antitoxin MazE
MSSAGRGGSGMRKCSIADILQTVKSEPVYLAMQSRGVVTIPAEIRRRLHAEQPGAQLRLVEIREGVYELTAVAAVPAEQAWFWSERWQAMEQEAEAAFAAGDTKVFGDLDSFIADLDAD